LLAWDSTTVNVSSGSSIVSPMIGTWIVFEVSRLLKVRVPAFAW